MSAVNPTKRQIEAMLAGQVYRDGNDQRRVVVVSDDDDGSYETVRVALAGIDAIDRMRAQWIAECSAPYGSDLTPLLAVVLKTLYDAGFVFAQAPIAESARMDRIGERITATVTFSATGIIWQPDSR